MILKLETKNIKKTSKTNYWNQTVAGSEDDDRDVKLYDRNRGNDGDIAEDSLDNDDDKCDDGGTDTGDIGVVDEDEVNKEDGNSGKGCNIKVSTKEEEYEDEHEFDNDDDDDK